MLNVSEIIDNFFPLSEGLDDEGLRIIDDENCNWKLGANTERLGNAAITYKMLDCIATQNQQLHIIYHTIH